MPAWKFYGNSWVVNYFKKILRENKLKHAYLFSGPDGIGRSTFAKRFAQALFCQQPGSDGEPCGQCISCTKIEKDQHFDVKVMAREPGAKDFKVSQVLEAEKFLSITPYSSPYKIVVFKDFDKANVEAQNAILKTLEEAPSYAILILIAESTQNLLPTVISRCEVIDFRSVDLGTLRGLLTHKFPDHPSIELAARLADGRPGLAIRNCQPDGALLAEREAAVESFFSLLNLNLAERFDFSAKLWDMEKQSAAQIKKLNRKDLKSKEDNSDLSPEEYDLISRTIRYWYLILRDCAIIKQNAKVEIINYDHENKIRQLAAAVSLESIVDGIQNAQIAFRQINANVNKRLLLDVFLMELFDGSLIPLKTPKI